MERRSIPPLVGVTQGVNEGNTMSCLCRAGPGCPDSGGDGRGKLTGRGPLWQRNARRGSQALDQSDAVGRVHSGAGYPHTRAGCGVPVLWWLVEMVSVARDTDEVGPQVALGRRECCQETTPYAPNGAMLPSPWSQAQACAGRHCFPTKAGGSHRPIPCTSSGEGSWREKRYPAGCQVLSIRALPSQRLSEGANRLQCTGRR